MLAGYICGSNPAGPQNFLPLATELMVKIGALGLHRTGIDSRLCLQTSQSRSRQASGASAFHRVEQHDEDSMRITP